ncbi:hypothetical protein AM232_08245 [Bacillus sp. FJAT-21352]|nr:hypothetical protein DOZ91_06100 [Peribacillus frigoritolerans]KOR78447.1 hypothetical protein AM232_08245 [Bacillus sp. FJAT-21352]
MIGAGVRDSCGKSASRGDPAGESRGGSPTARGKRVPYVPINVKIVQAIKIDKLDFHRVCLQSEPILSWMGFSNFIINHGESLYHDL